MSNMKGKKKISVMYKEVRAGKSHGKQTFYYE